MNNFFGSWKTMTGSIFGKNAANNFFGSRSENGDNTLLEGPGSHSIMSSSSIVSSSDGKDTQSNMRSESIKSVSRNGKTVTTKTVVENGTTTVEVRENGKLTALMINGVAQPLDDEPQSLKDD